MKHTLLTVIILCAALILLAHYILLAVLGDPFNAGTLASLAASLFLCAAALNRHLSRPVIIPRLLKKILRAGLYCWLATFCIFTATVMYHSHDDHEPDARYLIICGGGIKNGRPSVSLARRIDRAYLYLTDNISVTAVASGGRDPREKISEARLIANILIEKGINPRRLMIEDRSHSTFQNIRNSKKLLETGDNTLSRKKIMILSSGFHLFRIKLIARSLGIQAGGIAAPTPWYVTPNYYLREYLALVKTIGYDLKFRFAPRGGIGSLHRSGSIIAFYSAPH